MTQAGFSLTAAEEATSALAALERTLLRTTEIPPARGGISPLRTIGRWSARAAMTAAVLVAIALGALTLGPRVLPVQTLIVLSGSMEPVLPVGSLIVLERVDARDLRTGDIITFQRPGRANELVTHRIVAERTNDGGERVFLTKGDASGVPDPWVIPGEGLGWRTALAVPALGYALEAMRSDAARALLLIVPLTGLAASALVAIWRPRRSARTA